MSWSRDIFSKARKDAEELYANEEHQRQRIEEKLAFAQQERERTIYPWINSIQGLLKEIESIENGEFFISSIEIGFHGNPSGNVTAMFIEELPNSPLGGGGHCSFGAHFEIRARSLGNARDFGIREFHLFPVSDNELACGVGNRYDCSRQVIVGSVGELCAFIKSVITEMAPAIARSQVEKQRS